MIERVVLTPRAQGHGLDATLYGELGAIIAMCAAATQNKPPVVEEASQLSVVAGTRNRPDLQLGSLLHVSWQSPT